MDYELSKKTPKYEISIDFITDILDSLFSLFYRESQGLIVDQTIEKVSFCAPDRNHEKGFSYICRDGTTRRWMCHGFLASKDSVRIVNELLSIQQRERERDKLDYPNNESGHRQWWWIDGFRSCFLLCLTLVINTIVDALVFFFFQGERLSHAVGCAFAVCLERKQKRDKECSVTMNFDTSNSTFTRSGSFRAAPLTERIQDPQEYRPAGNTSHLFLEPKSDSCISRVLIAHCGKF